MALTHRQNRFVQEYSITGNATESAKKAGYSEKSAYSQGQRLLKKDHIIKELDKLKKKTARKLEISREDILKKAYNIPLLYSEMLELAQRDDLDEDEELRLVRLGNLVKGSDFNKALEIINKMLGYNESDKMDITSKGEPIIINFNTKPND